MLLLIKNTVPWEIYALLAPANRPWPAAQEFQQLVRVIPATATADAFSTAYLLKWDLQATSVLRPHKDTHIMA